MSELRVLGLASLWVGLILVGCASRDVVRNPDEVTQSDDTEWIIIHEPIRK